MDRTGCPASLWLLCLLYCCAVLNSVAHEKPHWHTPLEALTGHTPDISALLQFSFWQPVYFAQDTKFPSDSPERLGHWVGIADNVGDALTYNIITDDKDHLIYSSPVRPVDSIRPTDVPNIKNHPVIRAIVMLVLLLQGRRANLFG